MEKEFILYEQVLALKELGFDEKCGACYYKKFDNEIGYHKVYRDFNFVSLTVSAPTFSQAFRWFREKYKLYPEIGLHDREDEETWRFTISILGYYELAYNQNVGKEPYHKTYEEAELDCLRKLIEIIKLIKNYRKRNKK